MRRGDKAGDGEVAGEVQGKLARKDRRVRLSREEYAKAWEAYRNDPTQQAVAEAVPCSSTAALRAIHQGVPALALPPLEKRLQDENRLAVAGEKSLAIDGERLDSEKAKHLAEAQLRAARVVVERQKDLLHDAAESRVEELRLTRVNRQSALAIAGVSARLLKTTTRLAEVLEESLDEVAEKGKRGLAALKELNLKPAHVVGLVARIAVTAEKVANISQAAVEMERLIMGEPTAILGVQRGGQPTGEETDFLAEAARIVKDRAERRRMASRVIDAVLVSRSDSDDVDDSEKLVEGVPADAEEESEEVTSG